MSVVYDSARPVPGFVEVTRSLWQRRELLLLLVRRDLTVRYRRSLLGVGWSLLNPLLTVAVMYVVFAALFRPASLGVPFVVYLLSGILVFSIAQQAITQVGVALVHGETILTRIRLQPELPASASALAAGVNALPLLPLLFAVQALTGTPIGWSAAAAPLVLICVLLLSVGVGLIVASLAVRVPDVIHLLGVGFYLLGFLTPTFYPLAVVPRSFRWLIELNPLTQYLAVFRAMMFGTPIPATGVATIVVLTPLAVWIGLRMFGRAARATVVVQAA